MFVRLVLAGGMNAGMVAEIKQGYYLIGRDKECQIRPESPTVSDRHCLLQHEGKFFRVLVLDGDSPTRLNHQSLKPKKWVLLNHGDMLQVGAVPFLVTITAQDPLLPIGAPGDEHSSTTSKSRPPNGPDALSAEDVEDFAKRDTAEIELDGMQETATRKSKTGTTGTKTRWKGSKGSKPRRSEKQPAQKEPGKSKDPNGVTEPTAGASKFNWRLMLACGIVAVAVGAGAYGIYRFFSG